MADVDAMLDLQYFMEDMDIPETRKTDLNWLGRNLGVRNSRHPNYQKAMLLIKSMLAVEMARR